MTASAFSESIEDYLEVILDLENIYKVARARDIADRLKINRGSVTGALKNLSKKGLINYEPYSYITLTSKGKKIALEITRRHAVLKNFLVNILFIDPEIAEKTACRMEHAIDKQTVDRLICFVEYIYNYGKNGKDLIQSFQSYCTSNKNKK